MAGAGTTPYSHSIINSNIKQLYAEPCVDLIPLKEIYERKKHPFEISNIDNFLENQIYPTIIPNSNKMDKIILSDPNEKVQTASCISVIKNLPISTSTYHNEDAIIASLNNNKKGQATSTSTSNDSVIVSQSDTHLDLDQKSSLGNDLLTTLN